MNTLTLIKKADPKAVCTAMHRSLTLHIVVLSTT